MSGTSGAFHGMGAASSTGGGGSAASSGMCVYRQQLHRDWVVGLQWIPELRLCVSVSGDPNASMVCFSAARLDVVRVFSVRKGMTCVAFSQDANVLVTGGADHLVRIWNPYVTRKATALLRGHRHTVVSVLCVGTFIVSIGHDLDLRVWSIFEHVCVQAFSMRSFVSPHTDVVSLSFNAPQRLLIVGANPPLVCPLRARTVDQIGRVRSHPRAVVGVCYSPAFQQLVTGCIGGVVSVWDVRTGKRVYRFMNAHDESAITSMSLDKQGRRLITGGRNGGVKVWNFHNGQCLAQMVSGRNEEVSEVLFVEADRTVVSTGWDRCVTGFRDISGTTVHPLFVFDGMRNKGHTEDILCMAHAPPNLLATGCYGGEICVWNLNFKALLCRLGGAGRDDFWEADVEHAVECLLFLDARIKRLSSNRGGLVREDEEGFNAQLRTAVLMSAHSGGWVRAWTVHMRGELAGEWCACQKESDAVSAMATNQSCAQLLTGDTSGWVRVWDIAGYYSGQHTQAFHSLEAPPILKQWRAHVRPVTAVAVIGGQFNCLATSSTDHTVRVWTMNGEWVGTLGQPDGWALGYPGTYACFHGHVPLDASDADVRDVVPGIPHDVDAEPAVASAGSSLCRGCIAGAFCPLTLHCSVVEMNPLSRVRRLRRISSGHDRTRRALSGRSRQASGSSSGRSQTARTDMDSPMASLRATLRARGTSASLGGSMHRDGSFADVPPGLRSRRMSGTWRASSAAGSDMDVVPELPNRPGGQATHGGLRSAASHDDRSSRGSLHQQHSLGHRGSGLSSGSLREAVVPQKRPGSRGADLSEVREADSRLLGSRPSSAAGGGPHAIAAHSGAGLASGPSRPNSSGSGVSRPPSRPSSSRLLGSSKGGAELGLAATTAPSEQDVRQLSAASSGDSAPRATPSARLRREADKRANRVASLASMRAPTVESYNAIRESMGLPRYVASWEEERSGFRG
jgi:WD40 repeat protein